jgi:hypothetical protein
MSVQLVTRTSKGLVETLFQAIDDLNSRKIEAEHARAISHTARTIVGIASLELEVRKFNKDTGQESSALKSLTIEGEKSAA